MKTFFLLFCSRQSVSFSSALSLDLKSTKTVEKSIPMSDEPYCRIVHTCKLFRILAHLSRRHNWAFLVEIFSLSVVFSSSLWLTFHIVILSEITRPIATKLVFKKPLEIDVQVCTNEGTTYFFIGGVLWFLIKCVKLISA